MAEMDWNAEFAAIAAQQIGADRNDQVRTIVKDLWTRGIFHRFARRHLTADADRDAIEQVVQETVALTMRHLNEDITPDTVASRASALSMVEGWCRNVITGLVRGGQDLLGGTAPVRRRLEQWRRAEEHLRERLGREPERDEVVAWLNANVVREAKEPLFDGQNHLPPETMPEIVDDDLLPPMARRVASAEDEALPALAAQQAVAELSTIVLARTGDESHVRVLRVWAQSVASGMIRAHSVTELANALGIERSAARHHMKVIRGALEQYRAAVE